MKVPDDAHTTELTRDLQLHLALCEEVLAMMTRESHELHGAGTYQAFDYYQRRKVLLPRLEQSLTALRAKRVAWQQINVEVRARYQAVTALLRSNQDLVMRIIVLDRENEQALLRRGLVPPRHLPAAQRQRPHYVADLYRRHAPR